MSYFDKIKDIEQALRDAKGIKTDGSHYYDQKIRSDAVAFEKLLKK